MSGDYHFGKTKDCKEKSRPRRIMIRVAVFWVLCRPLYHQKYIAKLGLAVVVLGTADPFDKFTGVCESWAPKDLQEKYNPALPGVILEEAPRPTSPRAPG